VKLTLAAIAAVLVCMLSLAARSYAMRGPARFETAYAEQERLALAAIDGHLRANLKKLSSR
jgi:ferric-dicitrate binding protein FerR (iron transport regulator)